MRPFPLLILIAVGTVGVEARADIIQTFDISGSSVFYGLAGDTNTLAGTVVIDTTTGVVQSISIVAGGSAEMGVD